MTMEDKRLSLIVGMLVALIAAVAVLCLLTEPKQSDTEPVQTENADILEAQPEQELDKSLETAEIFERELDEMFKLGILAEKCEIDKADTDGMNNFWTVPQEVSLEARESEKCYFANISLSNNAWMCGYISEKTGKLIYLTLNMYFQQGDEKLDRAPLDMGQSEEKTYYYDCFHRLMAEDMTLGELCDKLCEYWGFSAYSIPERQDLYHGEALGSETILKSVIDSGCIELYFDGDEPGEPMYLELFYYPGSVCMILGWGYAKG